jgi:hypothetical protein
MKPDQKIATGLATALMQTLGEPPNGVLSIWPEAQASGRFHIVVTRFLDGPSKRTLAWILHVPADTRLAVALAMVKAMLRTDP